MAKFKRIASSVEKVIGIFRSGERFEISQDGESLFDSGNRYEFVGFTTADGEYVTLDGERLLPGRCLGRVINDDSRKVYLLGDRRSLYVTLQNISDTSEVYVLRA